MQLKRDTDYAIRILYCLNQRAASGPPGAGRVPLKEIAIQAGVPKTAARRLCDRLEEKGVIVLCRGHEPLEKLYCASRCLPDCSLLTVIEAVEGTGELFSVFDKRTAAYVGCEAQIQRIQEDIEAVLKKTTLRTLFGGEDASA